MELNFNWRYGYYIYVYSTPYPNSEVIESYKWNDFKLDLFCKYKWYFEYRYALLRIKYPKNLIRHGEFKRDLTQIEFVDHLKNKIIGKKRTISKYKNKLSQFVNNCNSLFPIDDYEPYIAAVAKIARLEKELTEFQKQYENENRKI